MLHGSLIYGICNSLNSNSLSYYRLIMGLIDLQYRGVLLDTGRQG